MKKRVLFLGMMVSLSWNAMGVDDGHGFIHDALVNNASGITKNKWDIADNQGAISEDRQREKDFSLSIINNTGKIADTWSAMDATDEGYQDHEEVRDMIAEKTLESLNTTYEVIKENKENSKTAMATAKENTANIAGNKENLEKNTSSITAINEKLDEHKVAAAQRDKDIQDSVAKLEVTDKELKATDAKVNTAIDNLKETDKNLQATDAKLAQTDKNLKDAVTTLDEHHDAVYETIGTTRDANATAIKVVKADTNRDMILALRDGSAKDVKETNIKVDNNTANIAKNTDKIEYNSRGISNNSERIGSLEGKVDGLETEMKKGFAMAAAMSSIDFQVLDVGDAGFGFGVGNYKNSEAVSFGVGVRPTENMTLNVKGAMSTGKGQETMVGGGAVYKFNLFGG